MVRNQFVSPRYQLDPSNSTKERKNEIFLKSYSLSKKSKGVPLPFLKTLLDSFLCDETNKPNALIPSLSRPKSGRDWHPHLSYYVSEPTILIPNILNIMNKIQCGRLKLINENQFNKLLKKNSTTIIPQNLEVIITRTSILKLLKLRVSKKLNINNS